MREGLGIAWVATLALAGLMRAAEPPIRFSGVLTNEGEVRIALTHTHTSSTQWLAPGDEFFGYAIDRYDAKQDAVFLKKGSEEFRLSLVPARTEAPPATPAAAPAASAAPPASAAQRANGSVSPAPALGGAPPNPQTNNPPGTPPSAPPPPPGAANTAATAQTAAPAGANDPAGPAPAPAEAAPAGNSVNVAPPEALPLPGESSTTATRPSPEPGVGLDPTGTRYVARPGDTLADVARANGISLEHLQRLNPEAPAGSLQPGQVVRIR